MEKFTKKEQLEAIDKIVELVNKYQLNIVVDHQIKIIPFEAVKETEDAEK